MRSAIQITVLFVLGLICSFGYHKLAYPNIVRAQYSIQCSTFSTQYIECGDNPSCGLGQYAVSGAFETGEGTMASVPSSVPCEGTTCDNIQNIPTAVSNFGYCCDRDNDSYGGNHPGCPVATDCRDDIPAIHPNATEICDGVDNNCVNGTDEGFDADNDNYKTCTGDCNDNDASINPGALEDCDGIDNDCDNIIDEGEVCWCDGGPGSCGYHEQIMCAEQGLWCNNQNGCCEEPSPILIDVLGNGFALTDNAGGVMFSMNGGSARQISWTVGSTDDAWLAQDRNSNGVVDDGTELFGNFTAQPTPSGGAEKNGFLALAEFDDVVNGGNEDGVISGQDRVFRRLRLWQDVNHNGLSESAELHKLTDLGLRKISLDYRESNRADQYGNIFRYRTRVLDAHDAQLGRWAWDVFLVTR